jgi:hypothetical protein
MDAKQIIEEAGFVYIGGVRKCGTIVHRFHAPTPHAKMLSIYEPALLLEGPKALEKLLSPFGARVDKSVRYKL